MDLITIKGPIPTKKNSYKIGTNKNSGKKYLYKPQEITSYEELFHVLLPSKARGRGIDQKFILEAKMHLKNEAQDLDGAVTTLLDCLEKSGVITNDNLCYQIKAEKFIDKDNPRIEFGIFEYKGGDINEGKKII